ncbi:unnamed protein product [Cuscuta campestris]|uniref:Uncharacterized protein n=1 Tax=Cuscuta campestris TaxID=132261 RepID=A0A484MSM6_9ASTE|nr:unnamed protein product [Cuscuta campestris]
MRVLHAPYSFQFNVIFTIELPSLLFADVGVISCINQAHIIPFFTKIHYFWSQNCMNLIQRNVTFIALYLLTNNSIHKNHQQWRRKNQEYHPKMQAAPLVIIEDS